MEELSPGPSSGPHDLPGLFCGRFERMREEPANTGVQVFGPTLAVLDTQTGEPARACVLDAALLPTAEARAAFVRVLGELAEVNESTLVPQVFVGEDGERVVVCYDPLQGAFALRDMDDGPGSADHPQELQRLARQLARALATLHARGLVHGMLAGEAVFVGPRGPAAFQHGFAPLCARAELERRWAALDPALLAPELRGGGAFTPAVDAYAWGVAMTEFATGLRGAAALQADEPPGLPPGLWALFGACLVADPAARPQSGDELVRRLEALALGGEAVDPGASVAPAAVSLIAAAVSDSLSLGSGSQEHALEDSDPAELSMTSLQEMVVTGKRPPPSPSPRTPTLPPIRPPTLPPSALTASVAASIASAPARAASGPHSAVPGDAGGRSASGLRRVHVLTEDAIVRPGRSSGARAGDGPGEPSGALFDDSSPSRSDVREVAEAAPTTEPIPPPPDHAAPVKSAAPAATPAAAPVAAAAAPQRSDRSFWLAIAVLLLAVALAWAFT